MCKARELFLARFLRSAHCAVLSSLVFAAHESVALTVSVVTSDNGYPAHEVQWTDSAGLPRTAIMVDQNSTTAPYTGYLRQYSYEVNGQTRVCTGTENFAAGGNLEFSGDGFVQNHTAAGGDFSSGNGDGVPGTTTVTLEGTSHALITYSMPNYQIVDQAGNSQTVPTTVQWFFADGRSHPIFALSQDARATPGNIAGDSRSPYGDVAYDGDGVDSYVGGASYGDTYKFVTLAANEVTTNSGWMDTEANTIPYAMQWANPATVDAEMGHVATMPINLSDQGEDAQNYPVIDGRGISQPNGPMLTDESWAFQIINLQWPTATDANGVVIAAPITEKRLTWGANYGRVGGWDDSYPGSYIDPRYPDSVSTSLTQYNQHYNDPLGEIESGTRANGLLMAYSVFIVLGTHTGGYTNGTVGRQVIQMQNVALASLSASIGAVETSGPAGVASASSATMTYSPAGYDPTYATWEIAAKTNAVNATLTPAADYPLDHPVFVIQGYAASQLPASISVGTGLTKAGVDYFATLDSAGQRLWITVNRVVSNSVNLLVNVSGAQAAPYVPVFKTLHSFNGDGAGPVAGLVLPSGILYGTALEGGDSSDGTVFSFNTVNSEFLDLHVFPATGAGRTNSDGANPHGTLLYSDGALFGTTRSGGSSGNGTLFAVNINGAGFTNLHDFTGGADGDAAGPVAGVILSGTNLYGTTWGGGRANLGSVFSVGTNGLGFLTLYSFTGIPDGTEPWAGVIVSGTTIYGTASSGGAWGNGSIYAVRSEINGFTNFHSFTATTKTATNGDGAVPYGGLLLSGEWLYGTTSAGGASGKGTIFAINTNGTGFTNLYNFTGGGDGAAPAGGLLLWSNMLYGTATAGGISGNGTVFSVKTNGADFTTLYSFTNGVDGSNPQAGLIQSGNTLYGTAPNGGSNGLGTVFSLSWGPSLPVIDSIPAGATVGTVIEIGGQNFTGATAVDFNGLAAVFEVISAGEITATVPVGATTGPITVTTPAGTAQSMSAFTVLGPPTDLPIYTDSLLNGFQDYSWAMNVNYSNTDPVYSGTYSISVTAAAYTALDLEYDNLNTAPYASLDFWINGGPAGAQGLQVMGIVNQTAAGTYNLPALAPNTWTQFNIPLSALGVANITNCQGFWFWPTLDGTTTFYVDSVALDIATPPGLGVGVAPTVPKPGAFVLQLTGLSGSTYWMQTSTDLVNWISISTNILQSSSITVTNPLIPTATHQYWRTVWP